VDDIEVTNINFVEVIDSAAALANNISADIQEGGVVTMETQQALANFIAAYDKMHLELDEQTILQ
jgi:hypothetical protein